VNPEGLFAQNFALMTTLADWRVVYVKKSCTELCRGGATTHATNCIAESTRIQFRVVNFHGGKDKGFSSGISKPGSVKVVLYPDLGGFED